MLPAFLAAALLATAAHAAPGSLVIVGGALSPDNAAVHQAFASRRLPGAPAIAVIPSASGEPAGSARRLAAALKRHGVNPADVFLVHLASEDDPETPGIDESRWAANATNREEIAKIERAGAIWFAGGDQARTTRLLLQPDGSDTPMLSAIRQRLDSGAVIGGTSAGAAIMSRRMIMNGDSITALTRPVEPTLDPDERNTALVLGQGLGFLEPGLVDQHFDARARLGRLARALFELPAAERIGFGIDEDSALVIDFAANRATALGSAGVTILDARTATRRKGPAFGAEAMLLSVINAGDTIDLASLEITPASFKKPTSPRTRSAEPATAEPATAGIAFAPQRLEAMLHQDLLRGSPSIDRPSFRGSQASLFRFSRLSTSKGWTGVDPQDNDRQTISTVAFAIIPITLTLQENSP